MSKKDFFELETTVLVTRWLKQVAADPELRKFQNLITKVAELKGLISDPDN